MRPLCYRCEIDRGFYDAVAGVISGASVLYCADCYEIETGESVPGEVREWMEHPEFRT